MKKILVISLLVISIFTGCNNPINETKLKKPFYVSNNRAMSYDSILKKLIFYRKNPFYLNEKYSISNYDWGEWGGYIQFKDSSTKLKYVFPQNSIYQIGKFSFGYLTYSHSNHGMWGQVTIFKNPLKLFKLPDSTTIFTNKLKEQIDIYSKNENVTQTINISDLNDSLYTIVGVFVNRDNIYLVQSNLLFSNVTKLEPITIISKLDLSKKKYFVIDTIFQKTIFPSSPLGYSNLNNSEQYISFEVPRKNSNEEIVKGFLMLKEDSIFIINQK